MRTAIKEGVLWWPLVCAATACLMYRLQGSAHAAHYWAMLGLAAPELLFAKIERFRSHGLDVAVACELAAEQLGEDTEEVAVQHFAWKLENTGHGSKREAVE